MNASQFKNGLAWVSAKATAGYEGCHWMLSAGSSYMIYSIILNNGLQAGYSLLMLIPVALIAGAIWYGAIEHTLKVILPFAIGFLFTSKEDKEELSDEDRRAGWMSVVACTALLIATASLSFFINPQISNEIYEVEDSAVEIAQSEKVRDSYDNDVSILRSELEDTKAKEDAKVKEAKALGSKMIKDSWHVLGKRMTFLASRSNDSWAGPKIARKVAQAKRDSAKAVDAVLATLTAPTLQSRLTEYMKTSGSARDAIAVSTATLINTRQSEYKGKVEGMTNTLFWAVVFTLFLFVFLCCLMVNARMSRGEDIVDDDSPGIFKVAKEGLASWNKRLGEKYADKWDVKFVSTLPPLVPAIVSAGKDSGAESQDAQGAENSLPSGFQGKKSESEKEKASGKASAPPPPGLALPPKVNAGFWIDEAVAYRKRVYGWWTTAHNKKRTPATRESNRVKAEAAFRWFRAQGCKVTFKSPGKVGIKFPKS